MNQLQHWLTMGGYYLYIWPAYGMVIIVLIIKGFSIKCQRERVRKKLQQWFSQDESCS